MMSDFDKVIKRYGTDSLKYDFAVERGKPADVLPLWVADMDFSGPSCIRDALKKAVEPGIFGYTEAKSDYYAIVRSWYERHFGWQTEDDWIVKTPGVVFALAQAVLAYTEPGDAVLIETPVYYPFYEVIRDNNRTIVESPLRFEQGRYTMDYENLERQITEKKVRLMLLCSPHNPVGRVWHAEELRHLGEILRKHQVILVSDEIHADIVYEPAKHHIFSEAVPEMADQTIICTSPSKTFNIAGLQISNIFIRNKELRRRFKHTISASGYSQLNMLGIAAAKAAYGGGEAWLTECLAYLRGNLDYIRDFLKREMPSVRLIEPEGMYFAWLNFRETGLDYREVEERILYQAKLWLDDGSIFGKPGEGFERLVFACPRKTLEEAMHRLKSILA